MSFLAAEIPIVTPTPLPLAPPTAMPAPPALAVMDELSVAVREIEPFAAVTPRGFEASEALLLLIKERTVLVTVLPEPAPARATPVPFPPLEAPTAMVAPMVRAQICAVSVADNVTLPAAATFELSM